MKNKVLKEYSDKIFNKDSNFKEVILKVQKENRRVKIRKILSVAAVLFVMAVGFGIYRTRMEKMSNFYISSSKSVVGNIETMTEDGYMEKVNMDYVTQDGISMKVDSVVITDNYFEAILNMKIEKDVDLFSKSIYLDKSMEDTYREGIDFAYVVYDESNNVYSASTRISKYDVNDKIESYEKYVYNQLGIKYRFNDIYAVPLSTHCGYNLISKNGNNLIIQLSGETTKSFPRSKKMYIRISDLGVTDIYIENNESIKKEDHQISTAEWIFEMAIPEKFYDRETIELSLNERIDGLEISKFEVTEKRLVLNGTLNGLGEFISLGKDDKTGEWSKQRDNYLYISDEQCNRYIPVSANISDDNFEAAFDIDKNVLKNKLYLNVIVDGNLYSKEIISK